MSEPYVVVRFARPIDLDDESTDHGRTDVVYGPFDGSEAAAAFYNRLAATTKAYYAKALMPLTPPDRLHW